LGKKKTGGVFPGPPPPMPSRAFARVRIYML